MNCIKVFMKCKVARSSVIKQHLVKSGLKISSIGIMINMTYVFKGGMAVTRSLPT